MKSVDRAINANVMPDIASQLNQRADGTLDWVGMSNIHLPLNVSDSIGGHRMVGASVQAYVSLDDEKAKGIHMSRLFLLLEETFNDNALSPKSVKALLAEFLKSHKDLSQQAFVQLDFDYSIKRPSLKTDYSGWKSYPAYIAGVLQGDKLDIEMYVEVPYSSTCPCSAALARQLIQQQFAEDFGQQSQVDVDAVMQWLGTEQGIVATPHSQRSIAQIKVKLDDLDSDDVPLTALIDCVEAALKTPVQTAVKRADEQEFARLNGQNLMFCEDAARRLQSALNNDQRYRDFWVRVNHLESLHAHDAVSIVTKKVPDGYLPLP